MNTEVSYMYRDESNNKRGGSVILAGTITEEQTTRLTAAMDEEKYFIASQVNVPEVFLWDPAADYDPDDRSTYPADLGAGKYVVSSEDHCRHEFEDCSSTEAAPTDTRSIEEFVVAFETAKRDGWQQFQPESHKTTAKYAARRESILKLLEDEPAIQPNGYEVPDKPEQFIVLEFCGEDVSWAYDADDLDSAKLQINQSDTTDIDTYEVVDLDTGEKYRAVQTVTDFHKLPA